MTRLPAEQEPRSGGSIGSADTTPLLLRDSKKLYRLFERVFAAADDHHGGRRLLAWCVREFHAAFQHELGIQSVGLYSARHGRFQLVEQVGEWPTPPAALLETTPESWDVLREQGLVLGWDAGVAGGACWRRLAGERPAAAMLVSESRATHVVVLAFAADLAREQADLVLRTLRSVLSARVLQNRWGTSIREAAEVQRLLLPQASPRFCGYDIGARSVPADDVGGDFFDYLPIDANTLGIAIADASGHGLSAALAARDVATGLRMGVGRETNATHSIQHLNRVVHRSNAGGSFVSLLYAELGREGDLLYVNAGHPPALLFAGAATRTLRHGDIVLGPQPDALFRRHIEFLEPGATLVLYTDGIVERRTAGGDFFGTTGLEAAIRSATGRRSADVVDAVFREAHDFASGASWEDDATLVVVRRTPEPPSPTFS